MDSLVKGGQTFAHRLRMIRQVFKIALINSFLLGIVTFCLMLSDIPKELYQGTWYFLKTKFIEDVFEKVDIDAKFWAKATKEHVSSNHLTIPVNKVILRTQPYFHSLRVAIIKKVQISFAISSISLMLIIIFFWLRGYLSKQKKHMSGKKLSSIWLVKLKLLLLNRRSSVTLGSLPLIKGTETQHIIITGGTGSGKSNCINHLLTSIRMNHQKAIIVDTTGGFLNRFYRPGKDILLNPFDLRSVDWHPWAECENNFDYEALAESFIPHSYHDNENYWRQASRSVLSSVLQKLSDDKKNSEVCRWLLFETLPQLCKFVLGTKAASHMDINSEKTASSVRSVTSSFITCFEHLKDTKDPFSIKNWVQDEKIDSCLFIQCLPSQRTSLGPLISSWVSIAIRSLLHLNSNLKRRLWFILDELPSLQKVKDLEMLVTEGRKYGGCAVLSLQSIAQLEGIYGREQTRTIIGNCLTKVIFSEQDPEIAERISKMFGQREIKEFQEGISFGSQELRDGVNISSQQRFSPIITSTDIQSLKNNTAFVRFPGAYPITKIKLNIF